MLKLKEFVEAARRGGPALLKAATWLSGASLLTYLGFRSIFDVHPGERAVIFNRIVGVKDVVLAEGTHFIWPFLEWPILYTVRTVPRNFSAVTGNRDMQTVNISLRVLAHPDPETLPHLYRTLGTDYAERVLPSIVNEVLKQVIAQFTADALITQRETVSRLIRRNLTERARFFNVLLDDVSITNLTFGTEFTAAVEKKQVAAQEAERARFVVDRALQDKRSVVIRAQGESKSAEMIGEAIAQNPGFVELRRLEAAREIAHVIAASSNHVYLSSESLLLNLSSPYASAGRLAPIRRGL